MRIIIAVVIITALVLGWMRVMRPADLPVDQGLHLDYPVSHVNGPALVAIQPWLNQRHYQSPQILEQHLESYLQAARDGGAMRAGSIVVFPEHIGTWLVAAKAPVMGFRARKTDTAMAWLIVRHPLRFARAYFDSDERDRAAAAIFRMKAPAMARDYTRVFGRLAQKFEVTIVAGSIVLPNPQVRDGTLRPGQGPLYNVGAVFHPDGQIDAQLVRKVHPIPSEAGFTAAAPASELPVFNTLSGKLGVLICADSWHPDVYEALRGRGVQTMAVPAFLQPEKVWESPWHGYTTGWPKDADRGDELRITERQAWMRYALGGRLTSAGAVRGATAFLRGNLWDLGSDGANILVTADGAWVDGHAGGASISALALSPTTGIAPRP
ncbi:MAG: nitrilase-related carbon-nitrogen hydrolase [Robiginitomaculum sp.]|nr:nitrilase-related carbon-nitrogen hydrolase [Robiginitomaculum sp.]MDQ7076422.1 nitrilase-related carbon-nitrogen hydrolase [Robiginitomaculum sp.]